MFLEQYLDVVKICKKYYSKGKFEHAKAVESYVMKDSRYVLLNMEEQYLIRSVAMGHDLLEDTECPIIDLKTISIKMAEIIMLLTHTEEEPYYDYIQRIVNSKNIIAIIVKTADVKDHLIRKKTLTPKLIEKYDKIIPLLLYA